MKMTCRKQWEFVYLLLFSISITSTAAPEKEFLGDESDGNRSIPVHLIPLLDEDAQKITPLDEIAFPFSTKQTCGNDCHNYERISSGWHFNANNPDVRPGRVGEPWIFVDRKSGTQIPLSYRPWPGTFKPEEIGLSDWEFILRFGHHIPGGGVGEFEEIDDPAKRIRLFVSGTLEVNCLSCHDADPRHDQSEYTMQIIRENFRWAATATAGFAYVDGSAKELPDTYDHLMPGPMSNPKMIPPTVVYRENAFDYKEQVFFDVVREVPKERCYFCHTVSYGGELSLGQWAFDEDVHLAAGLTCVDCHRNGVDHNIVRGYEGEEEVSNNPLALLSSCEGCHKGVDGTEQPRGGRLAAPVPDHRGIPPHHFTRLTCTACHSGAWPENNSKRVRTSRAHILGVEKVRLPKDALPHIISPVFIKQTNDKIGPHHLIWPAYWGVLNEEGLSPLPTDNIRRIISRISKEKKEPVESEKTFDEQKIINILIALSSEEAIDGDPVYVCGGTLYRVTGEGKLVEDTHPAAEPYAWPLAHAVRPAAQSLGSGGCTDCHATEAVFCTGKVEVDAPFVAGGDAEREMHEFLAVDPAYMKSLALSFRFRLWSKIVIGISCGILAALLFLYGLRALAAISRWFSVESRKAR